MTPNDKKVNPELKYSLCSWISSLCPDITVYMLNKIKYFYKTSERKTIVCLRKEGSEKCIWLLSAFEDDTINLWAIYHASFPDSCCANNIRALNKALISARAELWHPDWNKTFKHYEPLSPPMISSALLSLSDLGLIPMYNDSMVCRATISMYMFDHLKTAHERFSHLHTTHNMTKNMYIFPWMISPSIIKRYGHKHS